MEAKDFIKEFDGELLIELDYESDNNW